MVHTEEISVLIVAATKLYRDGLARLIDDQSGFRTTGTANCARQGLALIGAKQPDVVLMDVELDEAFDAISEIGGSFPKTKVVAVGLEDATARIIACAEAGASGFITHEGSLNDLLHAIDCASSDELHCTPRVAAALAHRVASLAQKRQSTMNVHCLTAREMEVVKLVEKGLSNKQIAQAMCIGVATVKNHVHHILEKLNVRSRGQAAALVRQQNISSPP